ncbi:B3/B4 domain-containing protein [Aureispira anguillae]|uniref:Phenylalanine--tRNA ligase beta subunit-related protein n=1 Tax=Aureispira anguillae TaxID=2864201 RepID=A0A915YEG8_9BACT|nr:phenylalanine--tRNA ligase beta subunit-related protein [Aureispira anguillae]BDS11623.1 phenylalanine--tRNA ligase beta subunit-related protein [Aureispira anguillae]
MQKKIVIDPLLKEKCPQLTLGCLSCTVVWEEKSTALAAAIQQTCTDFSKKLETPAISKIATIASSRTAYKALGKDPSRYRLSAEALLRRVVKGKGLYEINTIVDTLNLISIQTGYSIGGYDLDKIDGDIVLGIGEEGEPYQAIGRGDLNISNLPIFRDAQGAFGSPTSDSTRTMVTAETTHFLMIFLNFGKHDNLQEVLERTVDYYQQFTTATNFQTTIID